jgi:class 3 adenylate cyclase
VDLEVYRDAGLYDPDMPRADERRRLLEFLESEGCSLEEMTLAHERGRLFALAGDRRIRPLVGLISLAEAAARLEVEVDVLGRAWRTLGVPDQGPDAPVLTPADVESLRTFLDVRSFLGDETALALARVAGAAIARITEAESAAMRTGMKSIDVGFSGDEVVTAKAYSAVTLLVPRIGAMLDAMHRQHLEATRVHFEDIDREVEDRTAFRCGVGFADLSGFTRLSQQLPLGELSMILSAFEETATDVVHARGGRIVKFLGDAVMWVCADPGALVQTAHDLAHHPKAAHVGIDVRAGLDYGRVLAQDGDYFGVPVNLASRLVALAEPGQVLGSAGLADVLSGDWIATPCPETTVRGFDDPVTPYALTPKG